MIIVMESRCGQDKIDQVVTEIQKLGFRAHVSQGEFRTIIGAIGEDGLADPKHLSALPGVENVVPIMSPYKLASREFHRQDSVFELPNGSKVGGGWCLAIAGPCAVENRDMLRENAKAMQAAGATVLRGGAFKPRTSPYSFMGHGVEALKWLREIGDELNMAVCTEVMDPRQVESVAQYADILQIGARNMQNYSLLWEVGKTDRVVLLKRGLAAPVTEWLMAAEYVLSEGNQRVLLCERGIKTFETSTRYSLDIGGIAVAKAQSHLPVIIDPSHAAGKRSLVGPLALGGLGAGADGFIIETHQCPEKALCDGPQAVPPTEFAKLLEQLRAVAKVLGKQFNPMTVPAQT